MNLWASPSRLLYTMPGSLLARASRALRHQFPMCQLLKRRHPETSSQRFVARCSQTSPGQLDKRVHDLQVEFKPLCVPPSNLQTRHSDGSNGGPESRWLLERSRTFLTS